MEQLKVFISTVLIIIVFCGCKNSSFEQESEPLNKIQRIETGHLQVVSVDSCEYVIWNYGYAGGIVHKQNCKFCAERSKNSPQKE